MLNYYELEEEREQNLSNIAQGYMVQSIEDQEIAWLETYGNIE